MLLSQSVHRKKRCIIDPRTYTQSHTPTEVQGAVDGPPPGVLICCNIWKRFCLQWKAFDSLYKTRYILWVVALLEVCDRYTKYGRHLAFYQELEIR